MDDKYQQFVFVSLVFCTHAWYIFMSTWFWAIKKADKQKNACLSAVTLDETIENTSIYERTVSFNIEWSKKQLFSMHCFYIVSYSIQYLIATILFFFLIY